MKIVHLILSVFLVGGGCSDTLQLEDNERLVYEGTVVDQDGNPLPNISVYGSSLDYDLGVDHTNANGHFRLVSVKPLTTPFNVEINLDNPKYSSTFYMYLPGSAKLFAQLYKTSILELKVKKPSVGNNVLTWKITYPDRACVYKFNSDDIDEESSSCHEEETEKGIHHPDEPDSTYYFYLIYGAAEFTYQINDQPKQSIELTIDQPQESYVFEY